MASPSVIALWRRSKCRAAKTRETGFNHGPLGSCQPRRAAHSPVPIGVARRQQRHRMRGPHRTASTAKENPLELKPVTPTAKRARKGGSPETSTLTGSKEGKDPSRMIVSLVRFTPGAHTYWHSHALGQTLHVTDGIGLVPKRNRHPDAPGRHRLHPARRGPLARRHSHQHDVPPCPCSKETRPGDSDGVTWVKPVTDDEYGRPTAVAVSTSVPLLRRSPQSFTATHSGTSVASGPRR